MQRRSAVLNFVFMAGLCCLPGRQSIPAADSGATKESGPNERLVASPRRSSALTICRSRCHMRYPAASTVVLPAWVGPMNMRRAQCTNKLMLMGFVNLTDTIARG